MFDGMVYASFVFDRETTKALSATNFSQLRWGLEGMCYATVDQPISQYSSIWRQHPPIPFEQLHIGAYYASLTDTAMITVRKTTSLWWYTFYKSSKG